MNDEEYRKIFKNVHLRADSKASGRWETNYGGEYFGAGIGGAITGRGADLLIIDDPHSEQSITDTSFDNAFDWYVSGTKTASTTRRCNSCSYDKMVRKRFDR